jgi:hypothetical protein
MPTLHSSNSPEPASPSSTLSEETTSVSSPFDPPRDRNGRALPVPGSQTDWAQVRRMIETGAPIPYDPEDGPYDPNDEAAVEAYWEESILVAADGTILQQPAPRK